MGFKEFAINYLNPFYLMWRLALFCYAGFCFFITLGWLPRLAVPELVLFVAAIGLVFVVRFSLSASTVIANFLTPFMFTVTGLFLNSEPSHPGFAATGGVFLLWAAGCLLAWNGLRSWGVGGISANDINSAVRRARGD